MLNGDEIAAITLMMQLKGWTEVMRPKIENRLRNKVKSLMMFPHERPKDEADDAALRGAIAELQWMLVSWENEIKVHEHNRLVEEQHAKGLTEANGYPVPTGQTG